MTCSCYSGQVFVSTKNTKNKTIIILSLQFTNLGYLEVPAAGAAAATAGSPPESLDVILLEKPTFEIN